MAGEGGQGARGKEERGAALSPAPRSLKWSSQVSEAVKRWMRVQASSKSASEVA